MDVVLTQEFLGEEEEADLVSWAVEDGSNVNKGDVICQLETSKLVSDFEAPATGRITFKAEEGDVVNVNEVLATIE